MMTLNWYTRALSSERRLPIGRTWTGVSLAVVTSRTNSSSSSPIAEYSANSSVSSWRSSFPEVGVDQREVSVEVVVPNPKDGAMVGQFSVEGGGLERLARQASGGPEDESHSVQALIEK